MSTSETLPTTYRGYIIRKETDPWRIKMGDLVNFDLIGNELGEMTGNAYNIARAKEMIDDLIAEKETPEPPSSPLSISGDNEDLEAALFAFKFYRDRIKAFTDRTPGTFKEMQSLKDRIQKWMDVTAQQIKDQKFDEETKD